MEFKIRAVQGDVAALIDASIGPKASLRQRAESLQKGTPRSLCVESTGWSW